MSTRPVRIGGTQLPAVAAAIVTVPARGQGYIFTRGTLVNTSAANRTVSLWLVPSGGTANDANLLVSGKVLLPGETWSIPDIERQFLAASGEVHGVADTAAEVSFVGSAMEVV